MKPKSEIKTPKEFLIELNPSFQNEEIEKIFTFHGEYLLYVMEKYKDHIIEELIKMELITRTKNALLKKGDIPSDDLL